MRPVVSIWPIVFVLLGVVACPLSRARAQEPVVEAVPIEEASPAEEPPAEEASPAEEEPPAESSGEEPPGEETPAEEPPAEEISEDEMAAKRAIECGRGESAPPVWIDRMQWGVYRGVCESAQWIDEFFGADEYQFNEAGGNYGRVGLGLGWDEEDGIDVDVDAKVRLALPRLEGRLDAFAGRYEEDEIVEGRSDDFASSSRIFRDTDSEWLAGLGYNAVKSARTRVDVDAGIDLDFPADVFVKGRYRRYLLVDDRSLVRLRQTVFWRSQRGWGTTSRADVERTLSSRRHLRWYGIATADESSEGVDWTTAVTFYRYLGERRAMAFELRADGETDAPVTLDEYGMRAIYRMGRWRDWLFFEARARIFWPRDEGEIGRDMAWGVGVGVEMLFGQHPWLRQRREDAAEEGEDD